MSDVLSVFSSYEEWACYPPSPNPPLNRKVRWPRSIPYTAIVLLGHRIQSELCALNLCPENHNVLQVVMMTCV